MKVLVALDGSLDARAAVRYGTQRVREYGGEMIALCVFPRHLFTDYGAGPAAEQNARRESLDRVEDVLQMIRDSGGNIHARLIMVDGRPEDKLLEFAEHEDVDLIVSPPRFSSLIEKVRCLMDIVSAEEQMASEASAQGPMGNELAEVWTGHEPR